MMGFIVSITASSGYIFFGVLVDSSPFGGFCGSSVCCFVVLCPRGRYACLTRGNAFLSSEPVFGLSRV